jgi:SAM-dependent methyltransferase
MNREQHWDGVYGTKAADEVSWFRPHLETSLALIEQAAPDRDSRIIDVGGGESTLVDDLLAKGYNKLTVLDISRTALEVTKLRLGDRAAGVEWLAADVTRIGLPLGAFDLWHDRAVFHFLTEASDREAYVRQVRMAVKPGGHVIIGTFGPEGPTKCSGLNVQRYDAQTLHGEFGSQFRLIESRKELHETPFGTTQQFLYCFCVID